MIERLEKIGAIQVILALKIQKESVSLFELKRNVECSNEAMRSALQVLLDLSIIKKQIDKGPPIKHLISLTEKGQEVAGKLEEIEKVLTS